MKPQTRPLIFIASSSERAALEGDCACAYPATTSPIPMPPTNGLVRLPSGIIHEEINHEFHVFLSPKSQNGASVLNQAAVDLLQRLNLPGACIEQSEDMADDLFSQGLLEPLKQETEMENGLRSTTLAAWLHITDRCNFRCTYCYLPHKREDMSLETGYASIASLFRSAAIHNFEKVKIKYAGGEPLLNYPLILALHDYAKDEAKRLGMVLEEIILSNGSLLTNKIAKELHDLKINLMISLDGFGQYHDTHRPYAGGGASFQAVSSAVELAIENGITPHISITVSGESALGLPTLLEWVLKRELPFNLNFYRENEFSVNASNLNMDEEKIINGILKAFDVVREHLPKRSLLASVIDRANMEQAHTRTCGVGENYLVFDQHGAVSKCQMQMHKPVASSFSEDPLALVQLDQTGIQNLKADEKDECNTCKWKHWCTGGCPLTSYRASGTYNKKSPNCNIYKRLFPEALKLEGLRILSTAENSLL